MENKLINKAKQKINPTQYTDLNKVLAYSKFETYHIPYNKMVLSVGLFLMGVCIITPFTNWLIYPIFKLTKRFV